MTQIVWHGDKVTKEVKDLAWQRVMGAATFLKSRIVRNVSVPTRAAGPSAPGEYPHVITGTLRRSVFQRPNKADVSVDVGTKLVYGIHWELTTRPYILRTYKEEWPQIRAILDGDYTRTIEDVQAEAAEMQEKRGKWREMAKERRGATRAAKKERKAGQRSKVKEHRAAVGHGKAVRRLMAWGRKAGMAKQQKQKAAERQAMATIRRQAKAEAKAMGGMLHARFRPPSMGEKRTASYRAAAGASGRASRGSIASAMAIMTARFSKGAEG